MGSAELNPNPSANNFYYEKTCLPGVNSHEACTYRSFSFERMRKTSLEGFVKKSVQVLIIVINCTYFFDYFLYSSSIVHLILFKHFKLKKSISHLTLL
jgi:hypothetical protein